MRGNPWEGEPRLGCLSWLVVCSVCAWPFHLLGIDDATTVLIGLVVGTVATFMIANRMAANQSRARVDEMAEAFRRDRR